MRTKLLTLLLILSAITFQAQIKTPAPSPSAKIEQAIGLSDVAVDYSRPAMRGRTIYGDLVPYGKIWRTGANMRTKFTTSTDLSIEGKDLKKGTYAILTVPNKDTWDVIFYTEYKAGGAPATLDESKVAAKVTVKTHSMNGSMENFTFGFGDLSDSSSGMMHIMCTLADIVFRIRPQKNAAFLNAIAHRVAVDIDEAGDDSQAGNIQTQLSFMPAKVADRHDPVAGYTHVCRKSRAAITAVDRSSFQDHIQ